MTSRDAAYREVAAEQAVIDNAWHEEVNRRVDEILHGDVELVDAEETQRLIRQRLTRH
ncbi:MAG: addiction module protein [Micrococcaceae bacterium]